MYDWSKTLTSYVQVGEIIIKRKFSENGKQMSNSVVPWIGFRTEPQLSWTPRCYWVLSSQALSVELTICAALIFPSTILSKFSGWPVSFHLSNKLARQTLFDECLCLFICLIKHVFCYLQLLFCLLFFSCIKSHSLKNYFISLHIMILYVMWWPWIKLS